MSNTVKAFTKMNSKPDILHESHEGQEVHFGGHYLHHEGHILVVDHVNQRRREETDFLLLI